MPYYFVDMHQAADFKSAKVVVEAGSFTDAAQKGCDAVENPPAWWDSVTVHEAAPFGGYASGVENNPDGSAIWQGHEFYQLNTSTIADAHYLKSQGWRFHEEDGNVFAYNSTAMRGDSDAS